MNCLNNLVGIKGGCEDETASLFINDLAGINVQAADAAISSEYQSGFELLRTKRTLAIEAIRNDIRQFLSGKIKLDSLIDSDIIGYYKDNLPTYASEAGYYKGTQLRIDEASHSELFVSSVRFQSQSTGDVTVHVFDLITGKEIDTYTIECVADEVTELVVNKTYQPFNKRLNLFFAVDPTAAYESTAYHGSSICCGALAGFYRCGGNMAYTRTAKIATSGTLINSNLESISTTAGLSLTYSLVCSAEPLICQLAGALGWPLLHRWGMEVMRELKFSKRLNSIVSLYAKDHAELLSEYEMEYSKSMDNLFRNIRMPNDRCYRCEPKTRATTLIP